MPKPGGKWRLVIDYHYVNSQMVDEAFPLPVIEDLFLKQSKNLIWSIFDWEDGFHQMGLEPECRPLTAFVTPWGLFKWTVLSMGLEAAPQAYQRMVQLCWEEPGVKPYIDDVLRGTPDTENNQDLDAPVTDGCIGQHYEDLCHILTCLRDWQLSIKPSKVFFLLRRVRFCGQILERGRRSADPEKVAAVPRWDWRDTRTPSHLKAFLGLAQWYAFYIDKFADHAALLTDALRGLDLTKEGKFKSTHPPLSVSRRKAVFQQFSSVAEAEREIGCLENRIRWTPEMIWDFGQLKETMLSRVQLYIPDTDRQFWIRTDASDFAVGGVLEQRRCKCPEADHPTQGCGCPLFPMAFSSRTLQGDKSHGKHASPMRDKETYAIVATLHKFHARLQQSKFFLKWPWVATDHCSLEYMTKEDFVTVSGPVGRRGRPHQFLSQLLVDVVYVPGQNQEIPDTPSRWSYPAYLYSPETNIHATEEDAEGVPADEREQRAHADQLLEGAEGQGETQFLHNFVAWHSSLSVSGGTPSDQEVDVFQDDAEFFAEFEDGYATYCSQVGTLFSVEGLPRRARQKAQRIAITQGRSQNWFARALGAALQCAPAGCVSDCDSDEPWATVRAGRLVPPEVSILHDDWTVFYEQDPQLMKVLASVRQEQASLWAPGYSFYTPRPDCLLLRYRGKHLLPQAISQKVIQACHTYVHEGVDKIFLLCDRRF